MARIALTGGSYEAANVIASCQRCVNLYPELMDPDQGEPSRMTYYQTPGYSLLATAPGGAIRGLYRASNGILYCVSGINVYYVSSLYVFTYIGSLLVNTGKPVLMADNGINVIVVDGTAAGFTFLMATHASWAQIVETGWYGSTYIDFTDTYFIANYINTPTFYISGSEAVTFDASDFAGKSSKPDYLVAAVVTHRVIWLIGVTGTEVWSNTGGGGLGTLSSGTAVDTFPFEAIPGVEMEDGCAAPYSIAKSDTKVFWLAQNVSGGRYVLEGAGYKTTRISTPAIESVFHNYSVISDCIAYCYMQRGHYFYVMSFPTADATWCYDTSTKKWHERVTIDTNGVEHRSTACYHAYAYNTNIVGDWSNGNLYKMDPSVFLDNGQTIKRLRSFPQLMDSDNNNRIMFHSFIADMSSGKDITSTDTPEISLIWSDDRGVTWGNPLIQSLGNTGYYNTNVKWNRLGMARSRVFQLEWNGNFHTALNGAFVDFNIAKS